MADAAAPERGGDMDVYMNCKAIGKSRRGMLLRYAGMPKQTISKHKKEKGYAGI
jgi:hypothetical protein